MSTYIKLYEQWLVEDQNPEVSSTPTQPVDPNQQQNQNTYSIKVTPSGITETPFTVNGVSDKEYSNADVNSFKVTTGNGGIKVDSQIMISPIGDPSGKMDVVVGNPNDPASMKTYKGATVEVNKA